MKTSVIVAAIAGGLVLGTAAFVPFGGQPLVAAEVQQPAADQKIVPPADEVQEPAVSEPGSQSSETTNPNAGAASSDPATGGSTSGSKYGFSKGGDDDDEGDDGDHEDSESEDEGDDD